MDEAQLIAEFTGFAAREGKGYSPLYERLAEIAAADPDIWGLLASAPAGFRKATLFFAALQHAVAAYPGEALAAWFPIVTAARCRTRSGGAVHAVLRGTRGPARRTDRDPPYPDQRGRSLGSAAPGARGRR